MLQNSCVLFFRYRSAPEQMLRAQNSNANHNNEMTQDERNFGTKALRRDGVRCDTKGGRALYGLSGGYAQACEAASFTALQRLQKLNTAAHKQDYTVVSLYLYR